jgi:signal transduction histidine kinase
MRRRRYARIIASYVLSLLVTIALLVMWVIYVVTSASTISALAQRAGSGSAAPHWAMLWTGVTLLALVIGGLTYQLALAIGARSYSHKQEQFVSNITHEMKSPLAAIKLHAQTLQQEDVTPAERDRSVAFILQQVDRMGTLVDNVLESSRLMARKTLLHLEPVALEPFFDAYFAEMRSHVEGRGVRLHAEVRTSAVVMATSEALRRIMTNLIDNAVRFSARGGEVRCRVDDQRTIVCIEVEDDGIGIPGNELSKIFDRFYQIGREISGRRKGTGLGLSIVMGLVKEMRGTVTAFSHEGRPGARFVVTLPVHGGRE